MISKADFAAWVDEKSQMLYRVARTILRNDEDCKDALQETILRAWESRHQLKDESLFGTWITRILINQCHTMLRKNRKYLLQDDVEQGSSNAPDPAISWAVESLPEKIRLPLVLHYLEGYHYDEIAHMLRIPKSTVRSRLVVARNALKMELTEEKEAWLYEA